MSNNNPPSPEPSSLADFYHEVDREIAALEPVCAGCGACCHFDKADHVLYASGLEREAIARVPFPDAADAGPDAIANGDRCPFQAGGRCLARAERVLGCRLHFCRAGGKKEEFELLSERAHNALKRLHDRLGREWDYRPLLPIRPDPIPEPLEISGS